MDWFGAFDAHEFLVEAVVEVGEMVGVKAHLVQDRCVQVPDMESVFDHGASQLIGFANTNAAGNAAARTCYRRRLAQLRRPARPLLLESLPWMSFELSRCRLWARLASLERSHSQELELSGRPNTVRK